MSTYDLSAKIDLDDAELAAGVPRALDRLDEVGEHAERSGKKVKKFGDDLDDLGGKLQGAGQVMSVGLTAPILAVGAGSLKAAADLDSLKRGLISVAGSSGEAEQQLTRLREIAKLPGLGFNEAVQGSIRLQAAGFSANQAEKSLSAFGNAIASVGGGKAELDGVTLALTQIASKGKISAEEINQLSERVPQVRKAMQAAFGTADTEVLQKSGISAEVFVGKLTAELAKIPPVTGGIKNDFENLTDTIQQSGAKVGASLVPAASTIINVVAPAVNTLADSYSELSPPVQAGLLAVAGTVAVAGPTVLALGAVVEGTSKVRDGWQALGDLRAVVTGAFKAKAVAATETAVAVASAKTIEMDATVLAAGAEKTAELSRQAHTRALWDEYRALEANSKAELDNAMAVRAGADAVAAGQATGATSAAMRTGRLAAGGIGAGGFGIGGASAGTGFLGTGLGAGAVAGAAITAGMVGYGIGSELNDKVSFDGGPSIGGAERQAAETNQATDAMLAKNPALKRIQELKAQEKRLRATLDSLAATGRDTKGSDAEKRLAALGKEIADIRRTGSDKPAEADKAQSEKDKKKFAAAADAQYDSLVESAKASIRVGDEQTKAQREARALLPLLAAHQADLAAKAKELEPLIKTDADSAAKYWKLVKEQTQTQDQAEELKQRAAKEAADNQKKAAAKAKQSQREQFALHSQALDNSVLAARAASAARGEGEDGDPNKKAIRENEIMRPVLTAKQGDLTAQARALIASGKRDAETVREYQQLEQDFWNLEIQKGTLAAGASKAEAAQQKKAGQEATKAFKAQLQISKDQAVARASEAMPGYEARGLVNELTPVLEQEQNALIADLQNYKVGTEDYWKAVAEIERSKRDLAKLEQSAAKEQIAQQKKAAEDTRKSIRERRQLLDADTRLIELQLKNDPTLTERQRKAAGSLLLARQYVAARQAVPGENALDQRQRMIEAEQIKSSIFENIRAQGGGRLNLQIAARQLEQMARQSAGLASSQQQLAEAHRAAKAAEAKTGGTFVGQVILTDPSPAKIAQAFEQLQRQQNRNTGNLAPAGGSGWGGR